MEHVKAHRIKKDKKCMSRCEKFVTEGNEKADESAEAGAMLDEGFMAEARIKTVQQEREEMYVALQCAADFSLHGGGMETVKSLSRSQKKSSFSLTRRVRKRSIERSGVLL